MCPLTQKGCRVTTGGSFPRVSRTTCSRSCCLSPTRTSHSPSVISSAACPSQHTVTLPCIVFVMRQTSRTATQDAAIPATSARYAELVACSPGTFCVILLDTNVVCFLSATQRLRVLILGCRSRCSLQLRFLLVFPWLIPPLFLLLFGRFGRDNVL